MAHIATIAPDDADGDLRQIYDCAIGRAGRIAQIIRVMSRDGNSVRASMDFYLAVMKRPNALSASRRELLAAVVSNVNECYY